MAKYMKNFVPGMDVPQEIVDRVAAKEKGAAQQAEGKKLAVEMIKELAEIGGRGRHTHHGRRVGAGRAGDRRSRRLAAAPGCGVAGRSDVTTTIDATLARRVNRGSGENAYKLLTSARNAAPACPVAGFGSFHPAQVMRAVQIGAVDAPSTAASSGCAPAARRAPRAAPRASTSQPSWTSCA